jgi:hypothetical protein
LGRRPGRQGASRIRRGGSKKLRRALRWQLTTGRHSSWLAKLAASEDDAAGLIDVAKTPDDALVPAHLMDIWDCFWRLTGDRPWNSVMVKAGDATVQSREPGPIPFASIDRYATRYGYTANGFDDLLKLVTAMDIEFLEISAEKAKRPDG